MSTRRVLFLLAVPALIIAVVASIWTWNGYTVPPVVEAQSVVVWAPHPDDETYAMGATIADMVSRGTSVTVVLLTDGEGSSYSDWWIERYGSDLDHDSDVDMWDFALARRSEFTNATKALGVDHVIFLGGADSQGVTGVLESDTPAQFASAIASASAQYDLEPAIHMTVSDYTEGESRTSDEHEHRDHISTHDAVKALAKNQSAGFVAMKVYEYEKPIWRRSAIETALYSSAAWEPKREALAAYGLIGRRSTTELWESANRERREFITEFD